MNNAFIIGFGKLGSHLFYALKQTGLYKYIYTKNSNREEINNSNLKASNVIFICTEDERIPFAVNEIADSHINLHNKLVFHTSGALKADILHLLKKKGAQIGSFHPVQTFEQVVKRYDKRFEGISIALEGDRNAVLRGGKIALALGSVPFRIRSKDKILHHICCVESSNYLVSHFKLINDISGKISAKSTNKKILKNGFNKRSFFDIYKPLILQTLLNVSKKGIRNSLTGPIERNDLKTINLHLKAIKESIPEIMQQYVIMAIETVKLAVEKGSLNNKEAAVIRKLLKSYIK
jgi:predicted short-subunit dehydrogenase-like oxidoreductase (DUF2520 family)